jgi:hypothetical protein
VSQINAQWHERHRMPRNATLAQRVEWHLDHARNCGCWPELPPKIAAELRRLRLRVPKRRRRATG